MTHRFKKGDIVLFDEDGDDVGIGQIMDIETDGGEVYYLLNITKIIRGDYVLTKTLDKNLKGRDHYCGFPDESIVASLGPLDFQLLMGEKDGKI
jgi:hypothetical protein